jgi:hypothetical protein
MRASLRRFAAVICLTAIGGLSASTALGGQTTASISTKVVEDLRLQQLWGMNYGTFSPGAAGGTVRTRTGVSPNTVATGSVKLVTNGGPAAFQVDGADNATFSIQVSPSVTLQSGSNSMTSTLTSIDSGQLGNGVGFIFMVEGTLTVGPNQPSGTYTGSYLVNVSY